MHPEQQKTLPHTPVGTSGIIGDNVKFSNILWGKT